MCSAPRRLDQWLATILQPRGYTLAKKTWLCWSTLSGELAIQWEAASFRLVFSQYNRLQLRGLETSSPLGSFQETFCVFRIAFYQSQIQISKTFLRFYGWFCEFLCCCGVQNRIDLSDASAWQLPQTAWPCPQACSSQPLALIPPMWMKP